MRIRRAQKNLLHTSQSQLKSLAKEQIQVVIQGQGSRTSHQSVVLITVGPGQKIKDLPDHRGIDQKNKKIPRILQKRGLVSRQVHRSLDQVSLLVPSNPDRASRPVLRNKPGLCARLYIAIDHLLVNLIVGLRREIHRHRLNTLPFLPLPKLVPLSTIVANRQTLPRPGKCLQLKRRSRSREKTYKKR